MYVLTKNNLFFPSSMEYVVINRSFCKNNTNYILLKLIKRMLIRLNRFDYKLHRYKAS